jgi:IclR family transcriptional regulator, acetate operon repressor
LAERNADHGEQRQDEKAGDSVRAVDRALDILLAFQPQDDALTVSDLLRRVDLSRPTLYRLLRTLQRKQFLIASGDPQRFRLGPAVARLSHVWTAGLDLGAAAEPMMRRLRDKTGETVALFVAEGAFRLCIAEVPSNQALSFRRGVGYRERLTVGASGKVILAYTPPPLPKVDFNPGKYARELALIKERGFAISKDELIQGALAVSQARLASSARARALDLRRSPNSESSCYAKLKRFLRCLENHSNEGTVLIPGRQGGQRVVSPPPRHTASA